MFPTETDTLPRRYKHPPITEAVIEIRFEQAVPIDKLEQVANKIKSNYVFLDPENTVEFQFDAGNQQASVATQSTGFRLNSINRDELTIVKTNAFACSKLAPYTGWEKLEHRGKRDWSILKKIIGFLRLTRVGIRYINRLDIPATPEQGIRLEEYFRIFPRIPEDSFKSISNYAMQVSMGIGEENFGVTVNAASVPSPLVGYLSCALDIDLFRDVDLPTRDEDIWAMIAEMRAMKNRAFENSITDKARSLFQQ